MFPIEAAVMRLIQIHRSCAPTVLSFPSLEPRNPVHVHRSLSSVPYVGRAHAALWPAACSYSALGARPGGVSGASPRAESFLSSCSGGESEWRGASWSSAQRRGECAFCAPFHHFTQTFSALLIARQLVLFRQVMCAYFTHTLRMLLRRNKTNQQNKYNKIGASSWTK